MKEIVITRSMRGLKWIQRQKFITVGKVFHIITLMAIEKPVIQCRKIYLGGILNRVQAFRYFFPP